jgi:hypothetical protein
VGAMAVTHHSSASLVSKETSNILAEMVRGDWAAAFGATRCLSFDRVQDPLVINGRIAPKGHAFSHRNSLTFVARHRPSASLDRLSVCAAVQTEESLCAIVVLVGTRSCKTGVTHEFFSLP